MRLGSISMLSRGESSMISICLKIFSLTKYTINYGQQQSQESCWALVKVEDGSWSFYDPEIANTLQSSSKVPGNK